MKTEEHYQTFVKHANEGRHTSAFLEFKKCPELVGLLVGDMGGEGLETYYADIRKHVGYKEAERFRIELEKYDVDTSDFLFLSNMEGLLELNEEVNRRDYGVKSD